METLVKKNNYKILKNYFDKDNFFQECIDSIFNKIEIISGKNVANKIRSVGLEKIHEFFPVEYIPFLQYAVHEDLKNILHRQMFQIVDIDLNFKNQFFLDQSLNFRFHYPYENEKKSKLTRKIFRCLNLKNYKNSKKEFNLAKEKSKKHKLDESDISKINYFKTNNNSLYLHSPHRDTWFAHSTKGINFWWGISDVTDLNGMMLFTKVTNFDLEHEINPAYVKDLYNLGKFVVPNLKSGDLLLFDAEILHASKINTSNDTRVVFSGRINITAPKFYEYTRQVKEPFWLNSKDVKIGNFSNLLVFKREKKNIVKKKLKKLKKNKLKIIDFHEKFTKNKKYKIVKINNNGKSLKLLLKFKNKKIAFIKNEEDTYAFEAMCPHLGYNLINSDISEGKVRCQGHGLEFDLKSGSSFCAKFKLRNYKIIKKTNYYYLQNKN
jgi:nitrite reductase/ring-hydroxylating ferredoxin subunit